MNVVIVWWNGLIAADKRPQGFVEPDVLGGTKSYRYARETAEGLPNWLSCRNKHKAFAFKCHFH